MHISAAKTLLIVTLIQSIIFSPIVMAEQLSLPSNDMTAPEISHIPITQQVKPGSTQEISAAVTDDTAVKSVTLFYREIGAKQYERKTMQRALDSSDYKVTIAVPSSDMEYYIQAEDTQGNSVLNGYSFSPLTIHVQSGVAGGTSDSIAAQANNDSSHNAASNSSSSSSNSKWIWIGLAVLAVGALASGGGGDSGGGGSGANTSGKSDETTVTVIGPTP